MGLDISPGGAYWSYTGFNRFRTRLAAEDGITLDAMDGFAIYGKSWDDAETTLTPLLHHSDCDGYIDSGECEEMLPRLREIRNKWLDVEPFDRDGVQLCLLIEGMEHCANHDCALRFT